MRFTRLIASTAIATTVLGGLGIATALSASAQDDGDLLTGNIYFLQNHKTLATALPSDQVTGGSYAALAPFTTVAVDSVCPATTAQVQAMVRYRTAAPEGTWAEASLGESQPYVLDANGHAYLDTGFENFNFAGVQTFLAGTSADLPVILTCQDADGVSLAYFTTEVNIAATGAGSTNGAWSQVTPPPPPAAAATTTTLGALPVGDVEQGTPVELSATVTSGAGTPTGSVEYFDGATSLGTSAIGTPLTVASLTVGVHSITAQYVASGNFAASTSAAGSVTVVSVPARATTTGLAVDVVSGAPYQSVTLTATVAATGNPAWVPTGSVTFKDNGVVVATSPVTAGVATLTRNTYGAGAHSFTAEFTGNAPYTNSVSTAVDASYQPVGGVDEQTITVDIPAGSIEITTPYTPTAPLHLGTAVLDPMTSTYSASAAFGDMTHATVDTADDAGIKVTDTRPGNLGFTAKVMSGPFSNGVSTFGGIHAGLTDMVAVQVAGNALQATNLTLTNHVPFVDGLDSAKTFATYAAGLPTGTAQMFGTFGIDEVPSSVTPGTYTALVIFTAV